MFEINGSRQPTLEDLAESLRDLGDMVVTMPAEESPSGKIDQPLRDITFYLELRVPGLEAPPDQLMADDLLRAAQMALDRGDEPRAFAHALRGLSYSPHDPNLWYVTSGAIFEFGGVELTIRLLYHVLWIHPGHRAARAELEALTAFLEGE